MPATDELLEIFAGSIFSKARALKHLKLSRRQRNRLRLSITHDIRTYGGLVFPDVRSPKVSEAALLEAESRHVQLWDKCWYDQPGFDPGRKMFHLEHVNPISSIQEECIQGGSKEAILRVLKTRLRLAWILKRENKELERLRYRTNRPDPDRAYEEAGIKLVKPRDNGPTA